MLKFRLLPILLLQLLLLTVGTTSVYSQTPPTSERIAFAAFRNGQWDIYAIGPDGNSSPWQLTNDHFEETDPAYSPDGARLAFAARRGNNWDVYLLDLLTGQETRLTSSPHYDGAPTWSPDGKQIAYESYRDGNMDIWLIDAVAEAPAVNLTADSPEGDFGPAWSPDGRFIAFTSWRPEEPDSTDPGHKELYLLEVESGEVTRLAGSTGAEEWVAWSPDGNKLVLVVDDLGNRELFTLDVSELPLDGPSPQPVTWLGRTDGPAWSPDGKAVAGVFHRWDGEIITVQEPENRHQLPRQITAVITVRGRLTWHKAATDFGHPVATLADTVPSARYVERIAANGEEAEPFNLVRLNDVKTGTPWLADTVDDSFLGWRYELRDEVGYDFLGELSDAARDVASYTDTSQYASWHKSGRAVDTLFDYYLGEQLAHEIVREDYSGETYWRVLLRCVDQSGQCGRPVVANPWNYSARARTQVAPEQGGIEKSIPTGYYVDMTALAREFDWYRISSYDDEEYGWTWHFLAFEYWHYQKRLEDNSATVTGKKHGNGAANWYRAMRDIYPQETLDRYFTWEKMRTMNEDPHLIALKGVPLPLKFKSWWALVEQAQ